MILFAAPIGGLLHLIIPLVVFGVWLIKTLLRNREEKGDSPARQKPPPRRPVQAGVNPMEPHDVDEFLDEVLGRGRPVARAGQPPAAPPPNVVVLRPGGPPPPPAQRRPPQQRRPRPVAQRPAQARGQIQPTAQQQASKKSAFAQSISDSVDQAAAATGSAGDATTKAAELKDSTRTTVRQTSIGEDILAMMRSPVDVRRALVLREILGPPLALRRRQR